MKKSKFKISHSLILLFVVSLLSGTFKEVLIFLLSLLFHEIGHIISAFIFRVKIKTMKLTNYGIVANLDIENTNIVKKIIIYLSGILFNGILIVLANKINLLTEYKEIIIMVNKLLIFFNLLLIYPLDGYNVMFSILSFYYNERYNKKAFKLSISISLVLILICFIISIYYKSLGLIIILIVLIYKNIIKIKRRDEEILFKIYSLLT